MSAQLQPPALPQSNERDIQLARVHRWRGLIDTQMHFNAMLMQARSISMSLVIAVFGGAALSLARAPDQHLTLPGTTVQLAAVLTVCALLLLVAVFVLDYFYYYRMLIAVVERTEKLERESQQSDSPIAFCLTTDVSQCVSRRRAATVLWIFYGIPFVSGVVFLVYLTWLST